MLELSGILGLIILAVIGRVLFEAGGVVVVIGGIVFFFAGINHLANAECLVEADQLGWTDSVYDDMRAENAKTRTWLPVLAIVMLISMMY